MKETTYKSIDFSSVHDFKTLAEIKKDMEESVSILKDEIPYLYLSPIDQSLRNEFELRFIKSNKPYTNLRDNTFIMSAFPNYEYLALELCVLWKQDPEHLLFRNSVVELTEQLEKEEVL